MTGRTHDLAAFATLAAVFVASPLREMSIATAVTAVFANMIGGLLPDIDQEGSDFWDKIRGGDILDEVVTPILGGHRNLSHSLLGLGVFYWLSWQLLGYISRFLIVDQQIVFIAFIIGLASHIIADMLTREGVPLLYPWKKKFGIPPIKLMRIKTNSWVERLFVFPGLLVFTGWILITHKDKLELFVKQYLKF
ncbi:hypothetical protein A2368_02840 [Candidatus Collierbacteria bacterium RIFOXYB1_FULL_49_13]|uniref:Metal-dependent hydrolase n=1 Tax=Candidatus Collierbacteria bacterium RIFOXYB1_FULL_49_13 TaxID=1817728 RepID=A0A1F5FF63_9BACT|nr:MAG: hypothetical protein A2368_02840 [Candidatus Collierbacteria bacterium RIFOXYB1_FULL_49_13]